MSARIHLLPVPLQHKIAAGEVIERPASVLKEMLENSLDAGAHDISVELLNGGIDRISLTDDGCGMSRADTEIAFQRYATSKLSSEEDLFRIGTYGFRGEALSSIAAVSEIILETRETAADTGTRVVIRGSERVELTDSGCAQGTSISVAKLFYNTPVRRKYLKTVSTEYRHCLEVFMDQALMFPNCAFRLFSNGKLEIQVSPTDSSRQRVTDLLGQEWEASLLEVDFCAEPYRIRGFVSLPDAARESRRHQYLFVNKRRVDDYLINYRVQQAYSTLLDRKRYPFFLLNIELPPDLVDVNVHPRKAQVKFQHTAEVYHVVEEAVISTLGSFDLVPQARIESVFPESAGVTAPGRSLPQFSQSDFQRWEQRESGSPVNLGSTKATFSESTDRPPRALAQLYTTYIVAEGQEGILLIDQHAAEERWMFEKLTRKIPLPPFSKGENQMHQGEDSQREIQSRLLSETVELGPREAVTLRESLNLVQRLGIDISEFGEREFVVRALPLVLAHTAIAPLISALVDELIEGKKGGKVDERILEKMAMRACKTSVKANERLTQMQMQAVIDNLYSCEQPYTCPHGRPTMIRLSESELEKLFGRR